MSIQARVNKLEKTKKKSNKGEIKVCFINGDNYKIDGVNLTPRAYQEHKAEFEKIDNSLMIEVIYAEAIP